MDELQYKSRLLLEKYLLQTVWPTFKMMYAMVLFWIDAFARYTGINAVFEVSTNCIQINSFRAVPCCIAIE